MVLLLDKSRILDVLKLAHETNIDLYPKPIRAVFFRTE